MFRTRLLTAALALSLLSGAASAEYYKCVQPNGIVTFQNCPCSGCPAPSAAPVTTADFQEGMAAMDKGDYATAIKKLLPLAMQGDAEAQSAVGTLYAIGQGVAQDDQEAVKRFRLAAEQGYSIAQLTLGDMYSVGRGTAQDQQEAAKWYRLAAKQGNAKAQTPLEKRHFIGPREALEADCQHDQRATRKPAIRSCLGRNSVRKYGKRVMGSFLC